jgi:hypothetical protein
MKPRAMRPGEPIDVFATTYNRSPYDVEVIRRRMGDMFGPDIRYGEQIYGTSMDCKKLFADFGTKLSS